MPTYDYICKACNERLEISHSMSEAPKTICPKCKKPTLKKQWGTGAGFIFKGTGFYETDFKGNSSCSNCSKGCGSSCSQCHKTA
ncbi:MAG: zinc ribbon domain-containing protein [Opitutales bacterium]|nr:zinc ribbon domain-containing protein [Opitutales bacterium]